MKIIKELQNYVIQKCGIPQVLTFLLFYHMCKHIYSAIRKTRFEARNKLYMLCLLRVEIRKNIVKLFWR